MGQIYSVGDGTFWRPVRDDLDTVLGKITAQTVARGRVVTGPYGVEYGPGFAFIDVLTDDTPRYAGGAEAHNAFGLTYSTNGDQWYGYDFFEGGNEAYGFRVGYTNGTGVDYESGSGEVIPSSFHNQNYLAQVGFNLNPFQKFEVRYTHQDQTETEYFARLFDLDYLGTDAVNLRLTDESPVGPWDEAILMGWYVDSRFQGDTNEPGKRSTIARINGALERALIPQPPQNNTGTVRFAGMTFGDLQSVGARNAYIFGDRDATNLMVGADVQFLNQRTEERYTTEADPPTVLPPPQFMNQDLQSFYTNLPRSNMIDPGAFAKWTWQATTYWTSTLGARVDFIHTEVDQDDIRPASSLPESVLVTNPLDREYGRGDVLYSFYLENDVDLNENWSAELSAGYSQRPPTLTERYSDGLFLALFQNGFTRVLGNDRLKSERLWQIDAGISCKYDRFRAGATAFHGWILDYITYGVLVIQDPRGAQLVQALNSKRATLTGAEINGAYDLSDSWELFGSVAYVDGRDRVINRSMSGIYPLEGRIGLRWHDPTAEDRYGVEFFGRIVDEQDRLAALRGNLNASIAQVEQFTPSFNVWHLRGYYQATTAMRVSGGIENVFDQNFLEHLDPRLPASTLDNLSAIQQLSPGITPYIGMEWKY